MKDGEPAQLTKFLSPHSLVRLHPSMGRYLNVKAGSTCSCHFGLHAVQVPVLYDTQVPVRQILISSALRTQLHLDALPDWISARVVSNKILVGPSIGILCNPTWNAEEKTLRASKQLPVLVKLCQFAKDEGVLCFVFRLSDVDFQGTLVKGYTFKDDKWSQAVYPLPDVIYDQVISRRQERSLEYAERRQRLSILYGSRIFNDGFFDKLQIHTWLMQNARLRPHIPVTTRYEKSSDAVLFVQKYAATFVKPVHGSLGLGIVRISRQPDGSICYAVKRRKQGPLHGRAASAVEAVEQLKKRLGSRPYIIQQGIPLACYQERPVDLRVLLQKDRSGEWKRTKFFARVAKQGEFTSNLTGGGEALPVSFVLEQIFPQREKRQKIYQQIRKVTRLTAEVIEEHSRKSFGELGIDLGVDNQGGVWVIEVNSKPWRKPTTDKGRQDLVDLAFQRPVQYAVHLATQS